MKLMSNCKCTRINFVFSWVLIYISSLSASGQCNIEKPGVIWTSNDPTISFYELAAHAAPMLWFSPDEMLLFNDQGRIDLPQAFPFESADGPVVYYKIRSLYAHNLSPLVPETADKEIDFRVLDLEEVVAIDLDFYYYFEEETGLGSHPHDIESITLQISVEHVPCPEIQYAIVINRVIARAHGLHWYNSVFDVDQQTFFPLSILLEEGKHASATDKNADGVFTPGYDVSKRVNDAWGVRDVITTGRLFSGGFQGWMAKTRNEESLLFPPYPENSIHYDDFLDRFGNAIKEDNTYELRPYPSFPRGEIDKKLKSLMKSKKPHDWPKVSRTKGNGKIKQWVKEERAFRAVGLSQRWDESSSLSFAIPLGILKSVEAPLTGGWLYHKIYLPLDTIETSNGQYYDRLIGHQIVHSSSASRWIDTYVGLGYEWHQDILPDNQFDGKLRFVSEAGIKVRLNISKTPLRFLKYISSEFWGIRIGWKNVGFREFRQSGFVLEIGAGVF